MTIPNPNPPIPDVDPFDPARLRLAAGRHAGPAAEKLLTSLPVQKPDRQAFVRVHPDPQYTEAVLAITMSEDGEIYLVDPELESQVAEEARPLMLRFAVTRSGNCFLWPIGVADAEGRMNKWHESALRASEAAKLEWVRVVSNRGAGAYETWRATGRHDDPVWPALTMGELFRLAFKDRFIRSLDHPILRKLLGAT